MVRATAIAIVAAGVAVAAQAAEPVVSFQKQVLPIFGQPCVSGHSVGGIGNVAGHLYLTTYAGLRAASRASSPSRAEDADRLEGAKDN